MRLSKLMVASLGLIAGSALPARSQDVVPGGWSAEFHYQSLGNAGTRGVEFPGAAATGLAPFLPRVYYAGASFPPASTSATGRRQTVNGLGALGSAIRRTSRSRRGQ